MDYGKQLNRSPPNPDPEATPSSPHPENDFAGTWMTDAPDVSEQARRQAMDGIHFYFGPEARYMSGSEYADAHPATPATEPVQYAQQFNISHITVYEPPVPGAGHYNHQFKVVPAYLPPAAPPGASAAVDMHASQFTPESSSVNSASPAAAVSGLTSLDAGSGVHLQVSGTQAKTPSPRKRRYNNDLTIDMHDGAWKANTPRRGSNRPQYVEASSVEDEYGELPAAHESSAPQDLGTPLELSIPQKSSTPPGSSPLPAPRTPQDSDTPSLPSSPPLLWPAPRSSSSLSTSRTSSPRSAILDDHPLSGSDPRSSSERSPERASSSSPSTIPESNADSNPESSSDWEPPPTPIKAQQHRANKDYTTPNCPTFPSDSHLHSVTGRTAEQLDDLFNPDNAPEADRLLKPNPPPKYGSYRRLGDFPIEDNEFNADEWVKDLEQNQKDIERARFERRGKVWLEDDEEFDADEWVKEMEERQNGDVSLTDDEDPYMEKDDAVQDTAIGVEQETAIRTTVIKVEEEDTVQGTVIKVEDEDEVMWDELPMVEQDDASADEDVERTVDAPRLKRRACT